MLVSLNARVNSRPQRTNFGSFPVPRHFGESKKLLDDVGFGDIKPTSDNIASLKTAFQKGKEVSGGDWGGVKVHLRQIAKRWGLDPEALAKP